MADQRFLRLAGLAVQLSLGVLNVVLALPRWVVTAHNAGGALLLIVLVYSKLPRLPQRR